MTSFILANIFSLLLSTQPPTEWAYTSYEPPADSVSWEYSVDHDRSSLVEWRANGIVQEVWEGGLLHVVGVWPHSIDLMVERRKREITEEKLKDLESIGVRCACH